MGYFIRGTGDNRTPVQHEREIFKDYLTGTFFNTQIGKRGSGKPIMIDDKGFKGMGVGDTKKYHFVPQVYGEGIEGQDASVTGNEDTIEEYLDDIRVGQVTKAFKKKGKMTDINTIINFRAEFKTQLSNWFRWRTEKDMVAALTGYITDGVTKLNGYALNKLGQLVLTGDAMSTALVKGAGRCFRPDFASNKFTNIVVPEANTSNNALLADMVAGDIMNTKLLDELASMAKTAGKYPIKPVRLSDGKEYYLLVLHPKAAIALRSDERWEKRVLASYTGTKALENDPIATGNMGIWENIIVKEADHITTATNGSLTIARNLLLGAEAGIMAYAQTLDYTEELFDYKRIMGVAGDEIRGIKKVTFDGVDLNCAQVVTAIA